MGGGQGRNRTGDLSLFRRTLLPTELPGLESVIRNHRLRDPDGLEPATSAVTGRRANQLRHGALWPRVRTLRGARETIAQHIAAAESGQQTASDQERLVTAAHAMVAGAVESPSSSGLGHRPFKAAARVRIPLGIQGQLALTRLNTSQSAVRLSHSMSSRERAGSETVRPVRRRRMPRTAQ